MRNGERGFTYLLLLFAMAVAGAGLGALGTQWATGAQRERETELLFRGREIGRALAAWRDATPGGQPASPQALELLLTDMRSGSPIHHLRRLYADPFTGQADWLLERDAQGGITGIASRSTRPALRRTGVPMRPVADTENPRVGDWLFTAPPPPARPTSAPDGTPASRVPPAKTGGRR